MYKLPLLLCLFLFAVPVCAQTSSAVLYTENGEQFFAGFNDKKLNETPTSNLRITGLREEYCILKLGFVNRSITPVTFTLALTPGNETTYSIRCNSKGEYVLRFIGTTLAGTTAEEIPGQLTIEYKEPVKPAAAQVTTPTIIVQQEIVAENDIEMTVLSTNPDASCETTVTDSTNSELIPADIVIQNYKGPVGCASPVSTLQFNEIRKEIAAVEDETKRIQLAKASISRYCFYSQQVKILCELIAYEESRLELAKEAYAHTYDLANYNTVNDVFNFETSVEELNAHISNFR